MVPTTLESVVPGGLLRVPLINGALELPSVEGGLPVGKVEALGDVATPTYPSGPSAGRV